MAKPGNKSAAAVAEAKFEHMGSTTFVGDSNLSCKELWGIDSNELVVIAEDKNGKYYTVKSMIGANYLDPYRLYKRIPVRNIDDK